MYKKFSVEFYKQCLPRAYRLITNNGYDSASPGSYWVVEKIELTTQISIRVIDAAKADLPTLITTDSKLRKRAEKDLDKTNLTGVAMVYIIVGNAETTWPEGMAEYDGQSVFSVFWQLNLDTGEIQVPKNQPSELFGIKKMIEAAIAATHEQTAGTVSFEEVRQKVAAATLKPKHHFAIFPFVVVAINAVILLLMYLAGFPENWRVPLYFGAIHPYYIYMHGQYWRLFTAIFVHFGFAHFFANTAGILIFGTRVEKYFGRLAFLAIYVISGLTGSLFSLFLTRGYAAGASGAVFGLVGAVFIFTHITMQSMDTLNWYVMIAYIGLSLAMGFGTPGVDNFAHIGGLIAGLLLGRSAVRLLMRTQQGEVAAPETPPGEIGEE